MTQPALQQAPKGAITAPLIISGVKGFPQIIIPQPFSNKNWDDMMNLLHVMKPGFITMSTHDSTVNENGSSNDIEANAPKTGPRSPYKSKTDQNSN